VITTSCSRRFFQEICLKNPIEILSLFECGGKTRKINIGKLGRSLKLVLEVIYYGDMTWGAFGCNPVPVPVLLELTLPRMRIGVFGCNSSK
jgi:hypothetical protein